MGKHRQNTRTFIIPNIGSIGSLKQLKTTKKNNKIDDFYSKNYSKGSTFFYVGNLNDKKKLLAKFGCKKISKGVEIKIPSLKYNSSGERDKISIIAKNNNKIKGSIFGKNGNLKDYVVLTIQEGYGVGLILVTENLKNYGWKPRQTIKSAIRKVFGYYQESKLTNFIQTELDSQEEQINWEILPSGEGDPKGEKLIGNRGEEIVSSSDNKFSNFLKGLNPTFIAQGKNKFNNYKVFGFSKEDIYIADSDVYGNATYIFKGNWQELSQKTKTELMSKKLYFSRFFHGEEWFKKIKKIFERKKNMPTLKNIGNIEELEIYFNNLQKETSKKEKIKIIKELLRNKKICELIKQRDSYTCTVCREVGFEKTSGGKYIEVHHLQEVSRGGPDKPFNMISVCANCHRKIHFGKTLK